MPVLNNPELKPSLYIVIGRMFFRIALLGLAPQLFWAADFMPVLVPIWPEALHQPILANVAAAFLLLSALLIAFRQGARIAALALGYFFLALFLFIQLPYILFISSLALEPGFWTNALKELALAGGAFILADTFSPISPGRRFNYAALGRFFFCFMLVVFGIDHFLYLGFVASLVPAWIPGPVFWTYFAAVALIGSGLVIFINRRRFLVSPLLALMLFLWLVLLHIPRYISAPPDNKSNELTSVFEALAYCGVALIIAGMCRPAPVAEETNENRA